jgi:hypothetical protein
VAEGPDPAAHREYEAPYRRFRASYRAAQPVELA